MDENNSPSSLNNIEQIRQLIFGDQIQDYDKRFQEVEQKIENLNKQFQSYKSEMDDRLKTLNQSISDDQTQMQKDIEAHHQTLVQEISVLKNHLSNLTDDKVSRSQLADQMINLAMQLKGESILDQIDSGPASDE